MIRLKLFVNRIIKSCFGRTGNDRQKSQRVRLVCRILVQIVLVEHYHCFSLETRVRVLVRVCEGTHGGG